ncbi:GH13915 [Drosophila grimshawi]|uniref:GH13915 n=1 Tax=Drosophila grimshawi TaxID=7222 RepID=B4K3I3_DROGR|nr:GH13915 [Drosophila grimshawi]
MLNGFVQIPGLLLPLIIMDRIGRRYSLCASMLICAICMGASAAIKSDDYAGSLTLFLIGKLAITETGNKVLPTTLEEARALDKSLPVKQSKLSVETKTAV